MMLQIKFEKKLLESEKKHSIFHQAYFIIIWVIITAFVRE